MMELVFAHLTRRIDNGELPQVGGRSGVGGRMCLCVSGCVFVCGMCAVWMCDVCVGAYV